MYQLQEVAVKSNPYNINKYIACFLAPFIFSSKIHLRLYNIAEDLRAL